MANSREEQLRNNRRLARQLVGAVALILVVIGPVHGAELVRGGAARRAG